jgi:hypothetical protein
MTACSGEMRADPRCEFTDARPFECIGDVGWHHRRPALSCCDACDRGKYLGRELRVESIDKRRG